MSECSLAVSAYLEAVPVAIRGLCLAGMARPVVAAFAARGRRRSAGFGPASMTDIGTLRPQGGIVSAPSESGRPVPLEWPGKAELAVVGSS